MAVAQLILLVAAVYAGLGLLFAVAFVIVGVTRVDPAAHGAPIGFRLLILPGVTVLWPVMLGKWLTAGRVRHDA